MFHNFEKSFAYQAQQGGDWGGWTPPWMREDEVDPREKRGHHHPHGHHERHEHAFGMHGRRPFGHHGPFGEGGPRGPFREGGPRGPFGEGRRFFGRGDVKFALLELLRERPMHGYEIMKALEEKSGGFYTPSAGTIYPTLQMLADRGFVTVQETEGKKTYAITDAGRAFLAEQQKADEGFAGAPRGRGFGGRRGFFNDPTIQALGSEVAEVARLFAIVVRSSFDHPEQLVRVRALLETTRQELKDLIYGANSSAEPKTDTGETPEVEQA
jgi:DNA-binding PadR family transcriptional regulator